MCWLKCVALVDLTYSDEMGNGLDTPMDARGNYLNDILALVRFFEQLIPDVNEETHTNPFTHTDIRLGDIRYKQPWVFIARVADGRSAPFGAQKAESAFDYVKRYIAENMYPC